MITTEALFTSPHGFRVATATPVQLAACRVRDGRPLGELRDDLDVLAAFGGPEAIAALPSERGIKPSEFWNISAPRTGKTTAALAACVADTQRLDLSQEGSRVEPGDDPPRFWIFSLTLDVADAPFTKLVRSLEVSPLLAPLVISSTDDTLTIRHPSGIPIEVMCTAGGEAGGGIANRWCAGIVADEAPKMHGRDKRVTNLSDVLSVARERLLPGAQIMCIGSPWAPSGPAYDAFHEYFGKPTDEIVVMRTTGPAGNPKYWTRERLDRLRSKDEAAWRIVELGEFMDPETSFASPVAIRKARRELPLELPPESGATYAAAVDVGKGRWSLVIVEGYTAKDDRLPYYRVALAQEVLGGPAAAWASVAATCRRYGLTSASVDQYAASESATIAEPHGLKLQERAWNASNRLEAFTDLATLIHSDRIELAPERTLIRDLMSVKKRTTQAGETIYLPHTSDGRHCDFAPALAAAVRAARHRCRLGNMKIMIVHRRESDAPRVRPRVRSRDFYSLPAAERLRRLAADE
jgi:hypothetical protein